MADVDLIVAGATIVTPLGRRRANLSVVDGRIASIGDEHPRAQREVDGSGLFLLPGGVDTHVHLMDPGDTSREDFPHGTAAAAVAGVTTVIEHTHGHPIRTRADFREKQAHLRGRAEVDYALAAHAWPGMESEVADLWRSGIAFFKVFTCTTHGVPGHDAATLQRHLRAQAEIGAISLIHCEDESLTADAERTLCASGRMDAALIYEWRSREAEFVAVSVASLLVRLNNARAVIAHVSNPDAAKIVKRQRVMGGQLAAETCPQYMVLREQEILEHGALRKFTPPARARSDADELAMWDLLRSGDLTHVSTDHAPSTMAQKYDGDLWSCHFGLPGLDSTMPILLDAVARNLLSLEDVVRLYATMPAQIYGLGATKGSLRLGADADFVLVDLAEQWVLKNDDVHSKAGWSPYAGRSLTGRAVQTYVRGRLVADQGRVVGERLGALVFGAGVQPE